MAVYTFARPAGLEEFIYPVTHTMLRTTHFAIFGVICLLLPALATAQSDNGKFNQEDKFRQLEEILPTPNSARTA